MVNTTKLMKQIVGSLSGDEITTIKNKWGVPHEHEHNGNHKNELRIGTVCSGTDAPIIALEQALQVLNNHNESTKGGRIKMKHVFSCENVKFKRNFIEQTTNPQLVYTDVTELASGKGMCHDGNTRDVPKDFNVLVAGTECVDFSSLSTSPKGLKGGGRSDITFWATHKLAKKYKPAIVVLENVAKCPAEEMMKAYEDLGYVAVHTKVCSSDYLLPQSRSRAYFVFLHKDGVNFPSKYSADEWASEWGNVMDLLGSKRREQLDKSPPKWTDFLVDRSDNDTTTKKKKKGGGRGKKISESLESKWLAEIIAIEKKEGLIPYNEKGGRPYTNATKNVAALAHLTDRAKMRLDVQFKRAKKAGIDPLKVPLLWNPAQQLRFTDPGVTSDGEPKTIAPCVTPKHEWIVSNRKGPLTGEEALALQGISIPKGVLSQFDCGQLRDLAGNAMSTTVVASVFLAIFIKAELVDSSCSLKKRSNRSTNGRSKQKKRRIT